MHLMSLVRTIGAAMRLTQFNAFSMFLSSYARKITTPKETIPLIAKHSCPQKYVRYGPRSIVECFYQIDPHCDYSSLCVSMMF